MNIIHDQEKHQFTAFNDDGVEVGHISYAPNGSGNIQATSTKVGSEFQGHGIAQKLLDALAGYAKENALTITPICSYVAAAFEKNPDKYAEVMTK